MSACLNIVPVAVVSRCTRVRLRLQLRRTYSTRRRSCWPAPWRHTLVVVLGERLDVSAIHPSRAVRAEPARRMSAGKGRRGVVELVRVLVCTSTFRVHRSPIRSDTPPPFWSATAMSQEDAAGEPCPKSDCRGEPWRAGLPAAHLDQLQARVGATSSSRGCASGRRSASRQASSAAQRLAQPRHERTDVAASASPAGSARIYHLRRPSSFCRSSRQKCAELWSRPAGSNVRFHLRTSGQSRPSLAAEACFRSHPTRHGRIPHRSSSSAAMSAPCGGGGGGVDSTTRSSVSSAYRSGAGRRRLDWCASRAHSSLKVRPCVGRVATAAPSATSSWPLRCHGQAFLGP